MVFNDQRVTEHFYPKIWICASDDFDEKRLIKAIVESIKGRPLLGEMDLDPLQKKLQELLNGKRYCYSLVLSKATRFSQSAYGLYHLKVIPFRHKVGKMMDQVMKKLNAIAEERKNFHLGEKIRERQVVRHDTDDVWNEDQQKWDNLRAVLKVGASGASILTTTRLEKVGSIMGTLQPCELSNLSLEDCSSLFMQRAFGQEKEINPNLEAIGKEIVKKMWWCASSSQDSWKYFVLQEERNRVGTCER
ncbi:hypothetical protein KY290_034451 [Solanum tuberosum]|uniref:NB-ARC domain-containing protein n=1 Tax=Solanum tuberosum TaxID=4113 RepID=A0ABQ7U520_SOLTU|nr:hypothetical protein KY290_034451 [Solanum tuberosum]